MVHISKEVQEDIISAALTLLKESKYDKDKAMKVLRLQLEANHFRHIDEVANFYSHIMDVICKNHNDGTTNR